MEILKSETAELYGKLMFNFTRDWQTALQGVPFHTPRNNADKLWLFYHSRQHLVLLPFLILDILMSV